MLVKSAIFHLDTMFIVVVQNNMLSFFGEK